MTLPWARSDLFSIICFLRGWSPYCAFVETAQPNQRLHFVLEYYEQFDGLSHVSEGEVDFWNRFQTDEMAAPRSGLSALTRRFDEELHVWLHISPHGRSPVWQDIQSYSNVGCLIPLTGTTTDHENFSWLQSINRPPVIARATDGGSLGYMIGLLPEIAGQLKAEKRLGRTETAPVLDTVAIERTAFDQEVKHPAFKLPNDGGWPAERDWEGNWRWTGPDIVDRMCIGDCPTDVSQVEIEFASNERHIGIAEKIAFQINGKRLKHDGRRLSARGGSVSVPVSADDARPLVLGVAAFPEAEIAPKYKGVIRACLSRVGFS